MGLTSFTFSNKANSRLGTFLSGSYLNGFKSDTFVALISTLGIGALNFARTGTATYTDSTGTLQTAATGVPRTDHHIWDGSAWVNQGLLLESDAATNLLTYSEQFDNAAWNKIVGLVNANTTTAPDGTLTADRFIDSNSGGTEFSQIHYSVAAIPSGTSTFSLYAKADGLNYVCLRTNNFDASSAGLSFFNLSNGTVSKESANHSNLNITDVGNGWYRCSISFTTTTDLSGTLVLQMSENGSSASVNSDGTSSIYIWGAQLEANSIPTSYIKTEATTATRNAETLTASAADLPYNLTAVSIQMEGTMSYADNNSVTEVLLLDWSADASNEIDVRVDTGSSGGSGAIVFRQRESGTVDVSLSPSNTYTPGINVPFNIASRHGSTFINGAVDGTALTANTTPTALPDLTTTDLDIAPNFNGTIKLLRIWGSDIGDTGIAAASD